ncbi:hypothetical protein OXX80_008489 [Metschnikowia pulcherrima]
MTPFASMSTFTDPLLRPRADSSTSSTSYSTDSSGCVVCPSTAGSCPQCPSGQECNLTSRTCKACPEYTCVKSSSSKAISNVQVGGIVGGVVGGVVVLALALFLYYMLIYRKKHPKLAGSDEINYEMESQVGDGVSDMGEKSERPNSEKTKNRRLSSYESFMRPPGYVKKNVANRESQRVPYTSDLQKRHSVATSVSTDNASNILPIAYIPGVTIRPTKNNTRSIFSYDTESVFSDFTGLDAASIQERDHAKNTMTAVKAQPRLVNVARIDEIAEEDEEDEKMDNDTSYWNSGSHTAANDSDSDVDSDIGEIKRATSTRRPHQGVLAAENGDFEPEGDDFDGYESADDGNQDDRDDGSKSFVLDIARES